MSESSMVIATYYERGTVTKFKSIFKPAWQHVGAAKRP